MSRFSRPLSISLGVTLVVFAGTADATSTTCTTSTVCSEDINSSSGVAIHGEANSGIGIRGTSNASTGFYGASRSGGTFFPGVEGESLDQSGDDVAGGFGLTASSGGTAPAYGVLAYGSLYGVYGDAAGPGNGSERPTTFGIAGYDAGGAPSGDTNVAVFGQSTHGTAILALANATTSNTVAYDDSMPYGIVAEAEPEGDNNAVGVNLVSASIPVEAYNPSTGDQVYLASPGEAIAAKYFDVNNSGAISATSYRLNDDTFIRTTGSSGVARMAFSARTAAPVLEDSGEAQLTEGRGYVKLDPALADVIDKRHAYRVFLTPQGDSNILYVTQKSPTGFMVVESRGGRSTLSFDYRIIAKPVNDDAAKLALAPPLPKPDFGRRRRPSARPANPQRPIDPFARLRAHVGAGTYARERKAVAASTTCTTSTVCTEYINSSSGVAIHGEANTGIGIRGTSNDSTGFYGASRSGSPFFPGVEGESLDQSGDDVAGGFGLTAANGGTAPAYGVLAYGSLFGVYGATAGSGNGTKDVPTSFGVFGYDAAGIAGRDTNVAVLGQTTHGTAVLALSNVSASATKAYDDSMPYAVAAEAESDRSNADAVALEAVSKSVPIEATSYEVLDLATPQYSLLATSYASSQDGTYVFSVDLKGNLIAKYLSTPTEQFVRTTGSSGTTRITYAPRSAAPVLEDSGEGHLVNGRGYVELDPAFSDVIDKRNAYRVFLTPEGDSEGLYVTQKSPTGFFVRESHGGRSTMSFDYRITAKPFGDNAQRLALAPPLRQPDIVSRHLQRAHPATPRQPRDPFARLKARVGPAEFTRELRAARNIETVP